MSENVWIQLCFDDTLPCCACSLRRVWQVSGARRPSACQRCLRWRPAFWRRRSSRSETTMPALSWRARHRPRCTPSTGVRTAKRPPAPSHTPTALAARHKQGYAALNALLPPPTPPIPPPPHPSTPPPIPPTLTTLGNLKRAGYQ